MPHDVFISYSTNDKKSAEAIRARLERKGTIRCWIAPRDIPPGEKWGRSILGAIKGARIMVLVFSRSANEATHVVSEVERAVSAGVIIIPFRIEKIQPEDDLELLLSRMQWLDAFEPPLELHLEALEQRITSILAQPPKAKPAAAKPDSAFDAEADKWDQDAVRASRPDPKSVPPAPEKKSWAMIALVALILFATCLELGWYFGFQRPADQEKLRQALAAGQAEVQKETNTASREASDQARPVAVTASSPVTPPSLPASAAGQNFTARNGMEMIWVPPLHAWVSKYPVTQDDYEKVMNTNPSHFKGGNNPVEEVSWIDATDYCAKLSQADTGTKLPKGYRYHLPTDDQYSTFLGDASLQDAVTSLGTPRTSTAPVGSKGPNQFGLYDTRGNVWEWCIDWYDAQIAALDSSPRDPEGGQKYKVMRGGSWSSSGPTALGATGRGSHTPGRSDDFVGFRCVAVPDPIQ